MDALVTTEWLAGELGKPDLRILDATWFLPGEPRDARGEFEGGHIPGAMFFDINLISDKTSPLPTMLPPADQFAAQLGALGVSDGDRVVLYDDAPHHTAARAWWMLQSFGIDAALLDGGLAKWKAEGRPLERGTQPVDPGRITVRPNHALVRSLDQVRAGLGGHQEQLVDARSPARFTGQETETRPGLASGHIPGSANVPYSSFFNPDGTWKHPTSLRLVLEDEGVEVERPVIATCGSGISAAVIVFALHLLGHPAALYDGSWVEWGADPDTRKATGAA
ncbi:3-mercaptopyruvate sulfurtransferase [Sphingomonas sp. MG17]|uniref:Sulfurtransferase n=1 Tax=Sphingomonas tagetis TaxID=2949092 RepID=A0A9X2HKT9_9SPHN|nr:3-mercaptopyruvate sulfurtransferase [Sphingomonas tagetis]MCP3729679.1 3-mercaptopyruvate sulfurtransferase [Sphingomonas tagetis]